MARVDFVLGIRNTGGARARDISVEAAMLNAGPAQDQQIGLFFRQPAAAGEKIAEIAPFQSVEVRSSIALRRDQLQPIEIEGRPLLVPMIAINGRYNWGASNSGQTSASFLVGKETKGEKLAPVRLDLAPRVFRGLAAREHNLRVRV
jgi:hypothetical protein